MNSHIKAKTAGNVLFLVLIAVALFAGLTYVVTNSNRSAAGNTSGEQSKLLQSQMENVASAISTAIMRKKISERCTNQDILENFCPPSTLGCAWTAKPLCNVVLSTDPQAPKLNWVATRDNFYMRFSVRNQAATEALVWVDGGYSLGTEYSLIYAGFYFDRFDAYINFNLLADACLKNNSQNSLPAPDVIFGYSTAALNALIYSHQMKSPICIHDSARTAMQWFYPMSLDI